MTEQNQNADTGATTTETGTQQAAASNTATAEQQQPQGQTETTTQGGEVKAEGSEGEKAKPEGAPEKYEFKFGEGVEAVPEVVEELGTIAKELNLSQADAQRVADLGPKLAAAIAAKQKDAFETAKTAWINEAKADKEFGGAKFEENLAFVAKARDTFAGPELRKLFDATGLGNHPEVIRWFYRAGKQISEDSLVTSDNSGTRALDPASILFPAMKSA